MAHKITLIPGDGIGPEVTQATVRILEATGVKFEWETFMAGAEAFEKYQEYIPKELTESIERTQVGLKGPGDNADWRRLCQHQRRPAANSLSCTPTSVPFAICRTFPRAILMWI